MTRDYNTALCKGQGMLPETLRLLQAWDPGMTSLQLAEKVRSQGILPKATAQRVSDIVTRAFAPRYLRANGQPAGWLRLLVQKGVGIDRLNQIFLIYTAREHQILYDFIREIYWPRYSAGAQFLFREDSVSFIKSAQASGRMKTRWTEGNNTRIGRYLLSALYDFKMIGEPRGDRRPILPFSVSASTIIFLVHELHFSGVNDNQILTHSDWQLFGLTHTDVLSELRRLGKQGGFIIQSGDIVRISWSSKRMEDCLDGIAQ
jgi:bacteriophage exclusion system BrxA-like protein